jgi:solute carrier family 13 (sodium-dependent dicarboxylate transporter), member 2/3/5
MTDLRSQLQRIGVFAGPLLAVAVYFLVPKEYAGPDGKAVVFTSAGRIALGVMVWMALWWLTEAVELSTTALIPVAILPAFGAVGIREAAAPYAHHLIFLFIGGFTIALSMQRWGLDKRIALATLRVVGTKPANMIGGFMISTAVLSAFISNTATTAMMLPIALSVVMLLKDKMGAGKESENFGVSLMLAIAYSASMGGLATLVGTPPNAFLASFVADSIAEEYRAEISFAKWLMFGVPVTMCMLPFGWVLLTKWLYPTPPVQIEGGKKLIDEEYRALGPMKWGEKVTLVVFCCTGLGWISRPFLKGIEITIGGAELKPFATLSDPGIAMIAAVLLFAIPARSGKRESVMNWEMALKMPWDILILFGGGMSLAAAVKATGVAEFFASQATHIAGVPIIVLILLVVTAVIFLTELTSNLATTATLLPVLAAMSPGLGIHPYLLIFTATIAASCAFMMPVATPPNAIVFGSRLLTIPQMIKAGIWMNLAGVIVITILAWFLLEPVTGISLK